MKFSIFNFQFSTKRRGFTIIELLVVVTIVLVISTLAMVNYASTNKKSRDSRRMADLEKVALGLEMYRQENGSYPLNLTLLETEYIDKIPSDPKNGFSYYYNRTGEYTYTLDAQMEDVGSTTGTYGNNCGGVCNYRVVNP